MERNQSKGENLGITTDTLISDYKSKRLYNNNGLQTPDPIEKMQIQESPVFNFLSLSKLSDFLFSNELPSAEDKTMSVRVSSEDAKKLYALKGCKAVTNQPLEPHDLDIYNSICTIYRSNLFVNNNGLPRFTTSMIYENMTGSKARPSKARLNEIDKSIEKMRCILVSFDWTEHAKMNRIKEEDLNSKNIKPIVSCENLLYVSSLEMEINGQRVKTYTLLKKPCLLEYEEIVGQFTTYDHSLLTSNIFSKTKENVVIERYVIKRIYSIKNKKNNINNDCINLESFYDECNISTNRTIRQRKREVLLKVLDNLIAQKEISSYEFLYGAKKSIRSIRVHYEKSNNKNSKFKKYPKNGAKKR